MTSGRLTWRTPAWSRGALVEEFPRLRARYGGHVAGAVEFENSLMAELLDGPRGRDVRKTLKTIAEGRSIGPVEDFGDSIERLLLPHCLRLFRTCWLERLTDQQRRECAALALADFDAPAGAPPTDPHAVRLVARLLELWQAQVRQKELLRIRARDERRGRRRIAVGGGLTEDEQRQLSAARNRLLRFALGACGIGTGPKNIERLVTLAKSGAVL